MTKQIKIADRVEKFPMPEYGAPFLNKIYEKRKKIAVLFGLFFLAGTLFGVFRAEEKSVITDAEAEEIRIYQQKLEEYDRTEEELKESLEETEQKIIDLEKYINSSVYMKLDPSAIKVHSVQYVLKYEKGTEAAAVREDLLSFIDEDILQENTDDPAMSDAENRSEVLSASFSGKVLTVSLMHYDADKAEEIMAAVCRELTEQAGLIAASRGEFSMAEVRRWSFEKSNYSVAYTQYKYRNTLRSYYNSKAVYETKLSNTIAAGENYRTSGRPKTLRTGYGSFRFVIFWMLVGVFLAVTVSAAYICVLVFFPGKVKRSGYPENEK